MTDESKSYSPVHKAEDRPGVCHKCGRFLDTYVTKLIELDEPHRLECFHSEPSGCGKFGGSVVRSGWHLYSDG
jgi:hypothetical protein